MNTYFTSDFHFGHANIIKYCKRPFNSLEQMNKTLIENYNKRVKENDTVFFLGDFCFRNSKGGKKGEGEVHKAEYYINQLNGKIVFIRGNHDKNNSLKTPIERVVIKYGGKRICMVHNPIHCDSRFEINFCGHVHEKWKFKKLNSKSYMINVGVDVWNFKPITFDEIMKSFRKWKKEITKNNEKKAKSNEDLRKGAAKELQSKEVG